MKNADLALYRAKADGGGAYRFFEVEMDARMQARRVLELDLRKAIVNGEFELYYQPIIDVRSRTDHQLRGAGSLASSQRGLVAAARVHFDCGRNRAHRADGRMGIARGLAKRAVQWPKHVTIAVNVSPAQFKRRNFVPTVVGVLATSGWRPGRLELEITELVLLQDNRGCVRNSPSTPRSRNQDRDGRFRHRLFVARLSAQFPLRQDQDRPVLHPRSDDEGTTASRSFAPWSA